MTNEISTILKVKDQDVRVVRIDGKEYISLTDLAKNGNIRDHTDLLHLIILSNLENINAELIKMKMSQSERLINWNKTARDQLNLLKNNRFYEELTLKIENK